MIDLPITHLTPLYSARDSFINGLKAYFSASNPYFPRDVDYCAEHSSLPIFTKNKPPRLIVESSLDTLRLKNCVIFYHHAIEQMLKLYIDELDIRRDEIISFMKLLYLARNEGKLKSIKNKNHWEAVKALNHLRNKVIHSKYEFKDYRGLLGSEIILFFDDLFAELGFQFIDFLPFSSSQLYEKIKEYAVGVKDDFEDKQMWESFYRIEIMAYMNLLYETAGTGKLAEIDEKIKHYKYKLYVSDTTFPLPCPVCKYMMLVNWDCLWTQPFEKYEAMSLAELEKEFFEGDEWPLYPYPGFICCFYCGFFVPEDDFYDYWRKLEEGDREEVALEIIKRWREEESE